MYDRVVSRMRLVRNNALAAVATDWLDWSQSLPAFVVPRIVNPRHPGNDKGGERLTRIDNPGNDEGGERLARVYRLAACPALYITV